MGTDCRRAEVEIIHTSSCRYQVDWYDGVISDHMICAGSETGPVDRCQVAHALTNEGVMTSRQLQTICECVSFLMFWLFIQGDSRGASAVLQWGQRRASMWPG